MLFLAACFASGILFAAQFEIGLIAFGIVAPTAAILAIFLRKTAFATGLTALAFAAFGAAAYSAELASVRPDRIKSLYDHGEIVSHSPVEIEGVVRGAPESAVDGTFLTVRVEKIRSNGQELSASGDVRLFVVERPNSNQAPESRLKFGSRIRVACNLEREDEFLNPGVIPRREILDRQKIDATASVKSALLIEHIADESVFLPLAWVYNQRAKLIERFRGGLSPGAAGVMIASLLGNKYFLDKETADLFRDGGTFHILVISGLHITFIGGLLLLVVRRFTRNRWLQFVITILVMWAYTLAVGADVPVVRAAIMFTVLLYAYATYRTSRLLNSLGLCALVLLVWRPSDLFNPSLQLTFVSVGAIVAFAYPLIERLREIGSWTPTPVRPFPPRVSGWLRRICETLYWNPTAWAIESKRQIWSAKILKSPLGNNKIGGVAQKAFRYLFEGLLVSFIVGVWMLPLTVVYFHRISFASVFLNLWVGVLIALESFAAVGAALIATFSGPLATALFTIAEALNWLMLAMPRLFYDGGWASYRLPAYTGAARVVYAFYFVPVVLLTIMLYRWNPFSLRTESSVLRRGLVAGTAVLLACLVFTVSQSPFIAPRPDGRLTINFLDVGQGDSALVTLPDGRTMLVDGGGRMNYRRNSDVESESFIPDTLGIGEAVVSQVLWAKGLSRIDHLVATHSDADHAQGLIDVAKNFDIGSAAFTVAESPDQYAGLRRVLKRTDTPVETVARGDVLKFGDVRIEVLWPESTPSPRASDNDRSLVLRIIFGSRSFLLTGDIERGAEYALLQGGASVKADVVKVPHHGSQTSSTHDFVDAVGATYAVISVGRRSQFGHPHKDVVTRWKAARVNLMTTGERGTITVSTDGRDLQITTFTQ
ncbi:MAG: ComEC/Rec2 family competence protein [Pyrinomonadaceae bacterium]